MRVELKISGMSCGHCLSSVERLLKDVEGVLSTEINLPDDAKINFDENKISIAELKKSINDSEIYKVV